MSERTDYRKEEVEEIVSQSKCKWSVVFLLRYGFEFSYQEIADTLGISLGQVSSRMAYAKRFVDFRPKERKFGGRWAEIRRKVRNLEAGRTLGFALRPNEVRAARDAIVGSEGQYTTQYENGVLYVAPQVRVDPIAFRRARKKAGFNQRELAEKLGTSQGNVSHWEQGKGSASLTYQKAAHFFGLPLQRKDGL